MINFKYHNIKISLPELIWKKLLTITIIKFQFFPRINEKLRLLSKI